MAKAAKLVAGHQVIAGAVEHRVYLGHIARHDHRVCVGTGDEKAMDYVGAGGAQGDGPALRHRNAVRQKFELCSDNPDNRRSIRVDLRSEVAFGEFSALSECRRINRLDVPRRMHRHDEARKYDNGDDNAHHQYDDIGPATFDRLNLTFSRHSLTQLTGPRGRKTQK